jgi:hypothetical protein
MLPPRGVFTPWTRSIASYAPKYVGVPDVHPPAAGLCQPPRNPDECVKAI